MDLGCGLGLLAHALRQDGQAMPYYGVDNDADKIGRAIAAAGRTGLAPVRFEVVDLAHHLPQHEGSVAILDVLQYLRAPAQRQLLENVIAMLTPESGRASCRARVRQDVSIEVVTESLQKKTKRNKIDD